MMKDNDRDCQVSVYFPITHDIMSNMGLSPNNLKSGFQMRVP